MMNRINRSALALLTALILLGGAAAAGVYAGSAGTDQDPLVTLSYVEKRIQEVLNTVTAQIAELKKQGGTASTAASPGFVVVQAEKGSFVYFGGSTEFVVRGGKATAITTLAALHAARRIRGRDLGMGQIVPDNHHILVPRDDGRGLSIQDTTILLVKGAYTVAQ